MECVLCNARSSVGYCAECQILLCEECSIACGTCGKLVCPEHAHETRSHKRLCANCMGERKARVAERKAAAEANAEDTSLEALEQKEDDLADTVLVASARKPPPAWQLCLYTGAAGVVLMLILFLLPSYRRFALPWGGFFYTAYVLSLIPLISVTWGIMSLRAEDSFLHRNKSLTGLGLALLTIILGVVSVVTDPSRLAEQTTRAAEEQRKSLTPEELAEWRKSILNKYQEP